MNIPYYYYTAVREVVGQGLIPYAFVAKNSHPFIWHRNQRREGIYWTITFWKEITKEEYDYYYNTYDSDPYLKRFNK